MKKTFTIACFLIGLATLFPPLLFEAKWGFLFYRPPVVNIHMSGRIVGGAINWSMLIAEYVLIITFSISIYYGRKLFFQKKNEVDSKTTTEKRVNSTKPSSGRTQEQIQRDIEKVVAELLSKTNETKHQYKEAASPDKKVGLSAEDKRLRQIIEQKRKNKEFPFQR